MLALQMSITRRTRESPPLQLWTWGNWAMLAAFIFLAGRLVIPLPISVIGGNILLLIGMALNS
jgi:ABC-type Co2+ transport system permease subunit